jgi:dienelactone hydrolase
MVSRRPADLDRSNLYPHAGARRSRLGGLVSVWTLIGVLLSFARGPDDAEAQQRLVEPGEGISEIRTPASDAGIFSNAFDDAWTGVSNVQLQMPGASVLRGRLFLPPVWSTDTSAVVMAHGCKGMWSSGRPWPETPDAVAQSAIERWGLELSRNGYVALAIDSFSSRTPPGVSATDYQNQCQGDPFEGSVDPYVTRVQDIDLGIAWMRYRLGIASTSAVAAIGWSQGAESVLVRAAETDRLRDESLYRDAGNEVHALRAAVVFYPGCGADLGFEPGPFSGGSNSFWRPHRDLRMNHGSLDPLSGNCETRAHVAQTVYGSMPETGHWMDWNLYPGARHSFDTASSADWPTAACLPAEVGSDPDGCAQRDADIDSLDFLIDRL